MLRVEPKYPPRKIQDEEMLEDVALRFKNWRSGKQRCGRIPERLWTDVLQLLPRYSVENIAHEVNLNPDVILRRAGAVSGMDAADVTRGDCVTLKAQDLMGMGGSTGIWRLSITRSDQTKIELEVPADDKQEVMALVERVFYGGGAKTQGGC